MLRADARCHVGRLRRAPDRVEVRVPLRQHVGHGTWRLTRQARAGPLRQASRQLTAGLRQLEERTATKFINGSMTPLDTTLQQIHVCWRLVPEAISAWLSHTASALL